MRCHMGKRQLLAGTEEVRFNLLLLGSSSDDHLREKPAIRIKYSSNDISLSTNASVDLISVTEVPIG